MRFPSSAWSRIACAGAAIAVLASPSVASTTIRLATTYQTIPSVTSAAWVRSLDVNGDGIPDLVVLGSSNAIWYHRGLPGGGYAPAAPLITFPGAVSHWDAGDLNNDGKLDLVVADVTNTAWSVLGNGDGTFRTPVAILTSFSCASLKLADLDGDGRLDLVAAAQFGPLYTMKGLGDGRFQLTSIVSPPPTLPTDLAVADFDGDSRPDVMVADRSTNSLDFFRGLPGGLLDAPVIIPMPGVPTSVMVADLDQDGLPDAMVVNIASSSNIASVVYGARAGTPFGRLDIPASGVRSLAATDLDGDGYPELVASEANLYGDQVVVFGRTGPRSYSALHDFAAGPQPQSIVFTDTNGDGQLDIVVCNPPQSQLAVLHGHGALSFGDGEEIHTVSRMSGLDVGDVNGDNISDVVVVQGGTSGVAGVHLGAGDGTFLPIVTTLGPIGCCGHEAARLVDLNGDGRMDLVGLLGFYDRLDVVLGDGAGHFATGSSRALGSEPHSSMAIADFNGDGFPDIAVACDAGIAICLGSPTGGLSAPTFIGGGSARFVATADFNRDGHADLIATASAIDYEFGSSISVYLGNGDGTFTALPTFYGGYRPTTFAVGDANGDGIPDLAVGNYGDPSIAIFMGVGDGTFVAGPVLPGVRAASIAFADLDGDGVQDLVATMPDEACVNVWPGLRGGTFGPPLAFGTRSYPDLLMVADLNRDGSPDVVVGHMYKDVVDVLLNQTPGFPTPTLVSNVEATVKAGHVRLVWYSVAPELRLARVERASHRGWEAAGVVRLEGADYATFEQDVPDGEYDYRLTMNVSGQVVRAGQVHVSVHATARLGIRSCRWDAGAGAFSATLSLMGPSPARVQVMDVSGRIVGEDRWDQAAAGTQVRAIGAQGRIASGVYWARLSQAGQVVTRRVLVIE